MNYYSIIYSRYYVLGGLQFQLNSKQFGKTWSKQFQGIQFSPHSKQFGKAMIQAIRSKFPNLSNTAKQWPGLSMHVRDGMDRNMQAIHSVIELRFLFVKHDMIFVK